VLIQDFVITCYFFKSVTHAFQRSFSNVTVKITVEYSEYVFFDRIDPMVGYSNDQSKPFMPFFFFFANICLCFTIYHDDAKALRRLYTVRKETIQFTLNLLSFFFFF
jgi:hypothetical protein